VNTSLIIVIALELALVATLMGCDDAVSSTPTSNEEEPGMTLTEGLRTRRSIRQFGPDLLTADQIAQLCWAAQGVTERRLGFRTAPSAGATYPLELYVVTADGVDHYDPVANTLDDHLAGDVRRELMAAALGQPCVGRAPAVFVFATVIERTADRYGQRAGRYVWMEVGHAAQNLLLQAVALDLGGVPVGAFDDDAVAQCLSLPDDHAPAYLIPVGRPK